MSFDIYGNRLLPGHCEVHPHVHEEYPCSVCVAESNRKQQEEFGRSWADSELRMLRADLAQAAKERDEWKERFFYLSNLCAHGYVQIGNGGALAIGKRFWMRAGNEVYTGDSMAEIIDAAAARRDHDE